MQNEKVKFEFRALRITSEISGNPKSKIENPKWVAWGGE